MLICYKNFYVYCSLYCFALSCRLSAQFCQQLPCGCFACCSLNISFIHIPLLKPKTWLCLAYQGTFQPIFGDVMFSKIWGKLHIVPVVILENKYCFVSVTADTARIKLRWKFCKSTKYNNSLFFQWQNFKQVHCSLK